ncbi:alpha/beta fold hydrolase [Subtercola endophyticus]|uniref:alpha/beta fold hydrolase n=1 Tax=Subtercola endophyticus TaxID=2895559 RepID=UPI001E35B9C3|nr:alpha/beta hydrolase [Subtercola endophyticus]UFS57967.1 alpha/beta hydrolase [Subtercola endophyticus]
MMRRSYIDTSGGQVHAREWGDGSELVLLLHQTAASSAMFELFAAELEQAAIGHAYRFLAIDTPGFGESFVPADAYSLAEWADTVLEVATAQRAHSFHVLGHHTGAAIAATVAATAPDRVTSLAMIGALGLLPDERERWSDSVHGMLLDEHGSHLLTAWQQVATIDGDPLAFPPSLELRQREVVDKLKAGVRWHEAYLTVFTTDVLGTLAQTSCPAVLFSGTADVLHPYVEATLQARPGIDYVELAAGAYVLDQQPALVAKPYIEFLASVSAGVLA